MLNEPLPLSALPAHLTQLREAQGLTQSGLALLLGINQSSIARWESGESEPKLSALEAWAKVLGYELSAELAAVVPEAMQSEGPTLNLGVRQDRAGAKPYALPMKALQSHAVLLGGVGSGASAVRHLLAREALKEWAQTVVVIGTAYDSWWPELAAQLGVACETVTAGEEGTHGFEPLHGLSAGAQAEVLLSQLSFDDAYWQGLNRKLIGQLIGAYHAGAAKNKPLELTALQLGWMLEKGARLPAATKELRAAATAQDPAREYPMLTQPSEDAIKSALGFGMRLTNLYDTEAGKRVLDEGLARLDLTTPGLKYLAVDPLRAKDLAGLVNAGALAQLGEGGGGPTLVILEDVEALSQSSVHALVSRARMNHQAVVAGLRSAATLVEGYEVLLQNTNVRIVLRQSSLRDALAAAELLGVEVREEHVRRLVNGHVVGAMVRSSETVPVTVAEELRTLRAGEGWVQVARDGSVAKLDFTPPQ